MSTCLIISGGHCDHIKVNEEVNFIIACDAGYDNALRNNLKPDLIIGDFDSYNGDIETSRGDIPVLTFPVRKDDSDTMLAVKYATHHGYDRIIITCALGGRMDHLVANLQALSYIASKKCMGILISDSECMYSLFPGAYSFPKKNNSSFSLFAMTNDVQGISISGSKYDVTGVTLHHNDPMGLSNGWASDEINVSFVSGTLLAIESDLTNDGLI